MTRSIHDNHVLGYSVDIEDRSVVIRTEKRDGGRLVERTDVRFDGVVGYHFRDSLGGILTDIYPCDFESLVQDSSYSVLFEEWAKWSWPFQGGDEDPVAHAKATGATAFQIESAIGFDGFVVCQTMAIEAGQASAAADERRSEARR